MKNEIIVPLTGKEVNHAPAAKTYNLQIITAALMSIGGLALLFFGTCIEPQGEIHESLLIGFGEVAAHAASIARRVHMRLITPIQACIVVVRSTIAWFSVIVRSTIVLYIYIVMCCRIAAIIVVVRICVMIWIRMVS